MNKPLDDVIHRYRSDWSGRGKGSKETERRGADEMEINEVGKRGEGSDKEWRESGKGKAGRMKGKEKVDGLR